MKTIALAIFAMFVLSGCTVRVVEPNKHTYKHYSHQKIDNYERRPVHKKVVYRNVQKREVVNNNIYIVKNTTNYKNVKINHKQRTRKQKLRSNNKNKKVVNNTTYKKVRTNQKQVTKKEKVRKIKKQKKSKGTKKKED